MEYSFKLPEIAVLEGRQDFVIERCKGKRVLHIGCVDAGLLEQRFQAGELMHQRLALLARQLLMALHRTYIRIRDRKYSHCPQQFGEYTRLIDAEQVPE